MATADTGGGGLAPPASPPPAATNWRAALPLHAAIAGLDSSTVDRPGPCGATALHLACALGRADAVAALLAAGQWGSAARSFALPCLALPLPLPLTLIRSTRLPASAGADPLLLTAPSDPGAYLSSTELKATEVHGYLSSVCKGVLEGRQVTGQGCTLSP